MFEFQDCTILSIYTRDSSLFFGESIFYRKSVSKRSPKRAAGLGFEVHPALRKQTGGSLKPVLRYSSKIADPSLGNRRVVLSSDATRPGSSQREKFIVLVLCT